MKRLYNPFEIYSEQKLIFFGLLFLGIGSFFGYYFNGRFDGVLDLHFVNSATFGEVLADNLVNTLILGILLFISGWFINRKTRFIDLLTSALLARIPFYLLPFFNINNLIFNTTEKLLQITTDQNLNTLPLTDVLLISIFGIIAIGTLVWFSILLWNGFKVATNAKGAKTVLLFICTVLIAEIVSKYILTIYN